MRTALLAAALLLLSGAARAQAVNETIDLKGWKIHLERNDNGTYTCAAMWPFNDKSSIGFAADSGQHTFLIISEPAADLTKNKDYPAKFRVDRGKPKAVTGIATSTAMLVMPIADPDTDYAALGAGKAVTVEFGGNTYEKPLQGSHEAIRALARCIASAPS